MLGFIVTTTDENLSSFNYLFVLSTLKNKTKFLLTPVDYILFQNVCRWRECVSQLV